MKCLIDGASAGEVEQQICIFHAPSHLRTLLRQMASAEDSSGDREKVVLVMPEIENFLENWPKTLFLAIMNMGTKHVQDVDVNTPNENLLEQLGIWSVRPRRNPFDILI